MEIQHKIVHIVIISKKTNKRKKIRTKKLKKDLKPSTDDAAVLSSQLFQSAGYQTTTTTFTQTKKDWNVRPS